MLVGNYAFLIFLSLFVIRNFRGTCSSIEMLKGYMARKSLGTPFLQSEKLARNSDRLSMSRQSKPTKRDSISPCGSPWQPPWFKILLIRVVSCWAVWAVTGTRLNISGQFTPYLRYFLQQLCRRGVTTHCTLRLNLLSTWNLTIL